MSNLGIDFKWWGFGIMWGRPDEFFDHHLVTVHFGPINWSKHV